MIVLLPISKDDKRAPEEGMAEQGSLFSLDHTQLDIPQGLGLGAAGADFSIVPGG